MYAQMMCTVPCFFFQAEDGIRDLTVTGVQTCALPISLLCLQRLPKPRPPRSSSWARRSTPSDASPHAARASLSRSADHGPAAHDPAPALAHHLPAARAHARRDAFQLCADGRRRSEEHTSELQSQSNLVCRLLLEKKKKKTEPSSWASTTKKTRIATGRKQTLCPSSTTDT